jgi:hypothetical protein
MARKRYTNGAKLQMVLELNRNLAAGGSLRATAKYFGVQPKQLRDWRANTQRLVASSRSKRGLASGRKSSIDHLRPQLEAWINGQRSLNMAVSYTSVMARASQLDADFAEKGLSQRYQIVRRFCMSLGLSIRMATHQGQRKPEEVTEQAENWMLYARPIVSGPNVEKKFIINMDQTPVPFNLAPKRTLEKINSTTVGIRRSGNSTTRATAALAVCADGTKLKPFVIFKGTPNGRIARDELHTYPSSERIAFCCQQNAWMDDGQMLKWIEKVLKPFLEQKPPETEVVLDMYKVHISESTTAALAAIGVTAHIIPGGCTSLVQPVDVGINKPFKDRLRFQWWTWIIGQGIAGSIIKNPSRREVADWIDRAWQSIPGDMVANSWTSSDFNYFEDEEVEEEEV